MCMTFHEPRDIAEVFDSLALPSLGITISFHFSVQGIFKGGNAHQNTMNIRGNRPARKIAVEILGAQLNTYLR
jgi:hypothetical protein